MQDSYKNCQILSKKNTIVHLENSSWSKKLIFSHIIRIICENINLSWKNYHFRYHNLLICSSSLPIYIYHLVIYKSAYKFLTTQVLVEIFHLAQNPRVACTSYIRIYIKINLSPAFLIHTREKYLRGFFRRFLRSESIVKLVKKDWKKKFNFHVRSNFFSQREA